MTFEQAFEKLSKKFLKKSSKVADFNAEVCLTDEDCGGTFSIRVTNGKVDVEPYDYFEADVRISCTYKDFLKFISDQEATYNMECKSTRFADILAVVRKQSGKKEEEEKPVKAATKKTSVKSIEVKDESKSEAAAKTEKKSEPAKKRTGTKTAAKTSTKRTRKAAVNVSSDTKLETPKADAVEAVKTEVKPAETDKAVKTESVADKQDVKASPKTAEKTAAKTGKTGSKK